MRLIGALAIPLIALLSSCTQPSTTLRGFVYQSISTGGSPVAGAQVQLQVGGSTKSALTDSSGAFPLTYSGATS